MSRHFKKVKNIVLRKGYNTTECENILSKISSLKDEEVIAIYNPECIGIANATKDMFENTVEIKEIFSNKFANELADIIIDSNLKQIIYSSVALGWKKVIELIHQKKPSIKQKVLWHGAHAMFVQKDESYFFYSIMELLDRNIIDSIGFVKESMSDFYKIKGYNSFFVPNTVKNISSNCEKERSKFTQIGLYSAGNRWEKNTFNQLSALSIIPNSIVDIVPINDLILDFCKLMNIKIKNENLHYLKRQQLFDRMVQNDVNLYVTFTECSPVIPLESLELGVPCLTGNNHHYFKNSKLYDYLVVKSEDNIDEIARKTNIVLDNKQEIIKLYKAWKKEYDNFVNKKRQDFIES